MSLLTNDWGYTVDKSELNPNDPLVNTASEYMYQMATISYHTLHAATTVTIPAGRRGRRPGRHQGRHVRLPEHRQVLDRLRPDRPDPGCGPRADLDPHRPRAGRPARRRQRHRLGAHDGPRHRGAATSSKERPTTPTNPSHTAGSTATRTQRARAAPCASRGPPDVGSALPQARDLRAHEGDRTDGSRNEDHPQTAAAITAGWPPAMAIGRPRRTSRIAPLSSGAVRRPRLRTSNQSCTVTSGIVTRTGPHHCQPVTAVTVAAITMSTASSAGHESRHEARPRQPSITTEIDDDELQRRADQERKERADAEQHPRDQRHDERPGSTGSRVRPQPPCSDGTAVDRQRERSRTIAAATSPGCCRQP